MSQRTFVIFVLGLLGMRFATLPLLPALDPSEARYAVVARDMLQSGDFVTPMIWANGEYTPFFSKPPLLFWLQAGTMAALGVTELAARLPPFLASVCVLLVTWFTLRRYVASEVLRGSLLVLTSSPLFFLSAGIGLTDMLLCLSVGGALFSHYAFTREDDPVRARRWSLVTFALLGIGMLTKGPIALVEFGLPALAWSAWNRRLDDLARQAWWPGLLVFLLLWVPWFALTERANAGFLEYFFVNENFLRFFASEYGDRYGGGHKFPPGAAIVFFLLAFLPWLVLLAWHLRAPDARRLAKQRLGRSDLQFLGFAVVGNILFLSFSRHILGTYVLPVLPAAAVLLAAIFASLGLSAARQGRIAVGLVVVYSLAMILGMPLIEGGWSSQTILARAEAFQAERGAEGRIVFVEKRPFSARFYGGPNIDQIPWDAGNEHYEWYLDPPNGHLMILRRHHPDIVDPYVTDRLRRVEEIGRYTIWEPIEPN
ncbi:MAG: glycosyltransferase family 39 protein [Candidatus Binatia bacterium]|nr:glycosyltransferase family 39 protein [Candidatus Binatia bacterium]